MLIDHERVVYALKARLREGAAAGKRSWGERELLELLTDLELHYRVPEGQEGFDGRPTPRRGPVADPSQAQVATDGASAPSLLAPASAGAR
jgi:hypothetical protein